MMTERPMRPKVLAAVLAAGLVPFLAAVLMRWNDGCGPAAGDHAQYLLHAKAIAEGRSYTDTGYIHTTLNTISPPAYPPAVPAALALAAAFGRDGKPQPKLLMALFGAWFLIAVAVAIAAREGAPIAAGVVAVTAVAPAVVFGSSHAGSDVPFCAFVWTLIALADRRGRWGAARTAAAAAAGAAAVLTRAAGAALVPAALVFWLLRRKESGWGPLVVAGASAAAFGVMGFVLPVLSGYGDQAAVGLGGIVRVAFATIAKYRYGVFEALLYPFPSDALNDVYHLAALPLVVLGLASWLRRSASTFAAWFSLATVGVTLAFPLFTTRYLLPLYPLIVLGLLRGIELVSRLVLRTRTGLRPAVAAGCVAALVALAGLRLHAVQPRTAGLEELTPVRDLFAVLKAEHEKRPALRAVFFNPRVLTWETGVPAMGFFRAEPARVIAEMKAKGITDVVTGDLDSENPGTPALERTIAARPDAFHQDYSNGTFTVYRFEPDRSATEDTRADPPPQPAGS